MSGISISGSESIMADSSESDESEDFDNLKESLNRQWSEIQLALNNLNVWFCDDYSTHPMASFGMSKIQFAISSPQQLFPWAKIILRVRFPVSSGT